MGFGVGVGAGSGSGSGSGTGVTEPFDDGRETYEPVDGCVVVVVEVDATVDVVLEETTEVTVVDVEDFDELEHALATTRREKNPSNAIAASPVFFAPTINNSPH